MNKFDQLVASREDAVAAFKYIQQQGYETTCHLIYKEWKPVRSNVQNALMWVWNTAIADYVNETGLMGADTVSPDDVHESLVSDFWGKQSYVDPFTGEVKDKRWETKKFRVKQMAEHLEKIEFFAGAREIHLNHPVDYQYAMTGKK